MPTTCVFYAKNLKKRRYNQKEKIDIMLKSCKMSRISLREVVCAILGFWPKPDLTRLKF